ncbi:MAG: hypothetical protein ACLFRK_02105, partial [Candidatus Nanohaloarchaea archaeon]
EVIDQDDPDIEASFEDDISGLENATLSFEGEEDVWDDGDEDSVDLQIDSDDFDDLDDGEYDVDYEAYDEAGNEESGTWSFVVDTVEPDPDNFELDPEEGDHDVEGEDEFDIDVDFEATEDHESSVEALCIVEGDEEDSADLGQLEEGEDEEFTCEIPDDYFDEDVEFEVELEDEAGNDWSSDIYDYGLDESAPTISTLETSTGLDTFNDDFDVEYEALDAVSEIETVEYFFDEDTGEGDGTEVSDGNFTADTSDLDEGDNILYLRAEDDFGKWGSTESFDFDFRPDEEPEASLSVADELNVTSGTTENLEVEIENTGKILIPGGDVEASELGETVSFDSIPPNETESVYLEFSPTDDDLGMYEVDVSLSSVDASGTVSVLVSADEEARDEIESDLEDYEGRYENLSSRVDSLRPGLSQERKERLDEDFSTLESSAQDAREAVDEGEYYRADSILEGIDEEFNAADETFSTVEKEQSIDDRNKVIMVVAALFLLIIAGGIGFVVYSDEYEFDLSFLSEYELDIGNDQGVDTFESEDSGLVDKLKSKIEELRGGDEEDEVEYEFK